MHGCLYVLVLRSLARTSLQARKRVWSELEREGFALQLRFAGRCDYFSIGGRWSGRLSLLRLRHESPGKFKKFWTVLRNGKMKMPALKREFKKLFPDYQGLPPFGREDAGLYGHEDDALVMDEALFHQLRPGGKLKKAEPALADELEVILAEGHPEETDVYPDPPTNVEEAEKFWVVVIDYHF